MENYNGKMGGMEFGDRSSGDSSSGSLGQKMAREELEHVGKIAISITNQEGRAMFYKVERHKKIHKIFKNYCKIHNMDYPAVSFIHEGTRVNAQNTLHQLELNDGDEILAAMVASSG